MRDGGGTGDIRRRSRGRELGWGWDWGKNRGGNIHVVDGKITGAFGVSEAGLGSKEVHRIGTEVSPGGGERRHIG